MNKILYIVFIAEVNSKSIGELRNAITLAQKNGYEKINLLISSGGGNVVEGLNISAFIRSLSISTDTYNIGQIDSVANVIFSVGEKRYAGQNSSFLFHGVLMNWEKASFTEKQLEEQYLISKRLREDIAKKISEYTGKKEDDINNLMSNGATILNADEALKNGIINAIEDIKIPKEADLISIGNA
jgi:ATP-dependent protease ClpP protease subunit